jgi:hypothetical protein
MKAAAAVALLASAVSIALLIGVLRSQASERSQLAELRQLVEQSRAPTEDSQLRWAAMASAAGGAITLEQMRGALREALRSLDDRKGCRPEAAPSAKAEESPASLPAFAEANQIVRDALAGGVWGQAQADALGRVKEQLSSEQLMAISRQLNPAINSQQLRVQIKGPLF